MAAVVRVLLQAAQDRDLAEEIQRSPREVLERYTASASGSPVAFDAGLELAVHIPDPEEIVIVLSERGDSRVAYSQSIDAELSLYSEADVLAYHTDTGFGCTTAYTFCFTGCHSCSCHTNSTYSGCCR